MTLENWNCTFPDPNKNEFRTEFRKICNAINKWIDIKTKWFVDFWSHLLSESDLVKNSASINFLRKYLWDFLWIHISLESTEWWWFVDKSEDKNCERIVFNIKWDIWDWWLFHWPTRIPIWKELNSNSDWLRLNLKFDEDYKYLWNLWEWTVYANNNKRIKVFNIEENNKIYLEKFKIINWIWIEIRGEVLNIFKITKSHMSAWKCIVIWEC